MLSERSDPRDGETATTSAASGTPSRYSRLRSFRSTKMTLYISNLMPEISRPPTDRKGQEATDGLASLL